MKTIVIGHDVIDPKEKKERIEFKAAILERIKNAKEELEKVRMGPVDPGPLTD